MQKMTLKHTVKTRRFIEENHDNCTVCGKEFKNSDTTHLGYTQSKKIIYVGDCCSSNLTETIIRHAYLKRPYQIPDKKNIIWRFMDFTKFVSLISTKSLFFCRVDKFEDPFEGAKGFKKNQPKWDKGYLAFFEDAIRNPPKGEVCNMTDLQIKKDAKRLLLNLYQINLDSQKRTFVNCWHENEFESEAMWKLYTNNMTEGIAIRSTYDRLYKALGRNPDLSIGRVNYIDYNKKFAGVNDSFWYKRKSFEHEREVRVICIDRNVENEQGMFIEVNLNTLIESIYVSPTAQKWFIDLIKEILCKYDVDKKVKNSDMLIEPFY